MAPSIIFLALKILDKKKENILVRRFKGAKVWTMPLVSISMTSVDPFHRLPLALKEIAVGKDFKFISATPIVKYDHTENIWNEKEGKYIPKIFRSFIYSLQYEGHVYPSLPSAVRDDYDKVMWAPVDGLKTLGHFNRPMDAFIKAVEKEPNLK